MVTNQRTVLPVTANQTPPFPGASEDARSRRGCVRPLLGAQCGGEDQSEASIVTANESSVFQVRIGDKSYEEWLVASSSRDKTLRVWSEREGRCVHVIKVISWYNLFILNA